MPEIMKARPSYVRFEKRPIEDRAETLRKGAFSTKDVVHAIITPAGSKDQYAFVADEWLARLDQQVKEERIPFEWVDMYRRAYEAYKRGEELPLDGTPIKEWPPLSPAQRVNLIALHVLTVEDLAAANAETLARIGMGAQNLVEKAKTWLQASKDKGVVVEQVVALQTENVALKDTVKSQGDAIAKMQVQLELLLPKPPAVLIPKPAELEV